jgi:hypothetical protein
MFIIIFSGIWALLGIIFLIIGIVMIENRKKKEIRCTLKTYGKVKDIVRRQSYDSDGNYSHSWNPVFEYKIGELTFIKESNYGSSQSKYAIGQDVEVYYNPEDYNDYYITDEMLPVTIGTIFTVVGIVAIIISIFIIILSAILVF